MLDTSLSHNQSIFDLNIKVAGLQIAVPVYETDCDTSLTERLLSKYPEIDRQRNKDKIKTKVIESFRKIMKSTSVKPETRRKIGQFLDRCEIEVTISLKEHNQNQGSRFHSKRESLSNLTNLEINKSMSKQKQKLSKSKPVPNKKFTKLYSITKQIFSQVKQTPILKTQKQNMSKKIKQLSKNKHPTHKSRPSKQIEQQIMNRIERKLANYQKTNAHPHSKIEIMNLTTIVDPRQQQSFFSFSELPSIELVDRNGRQNQPNQKQDDSIVSMSNEKSRYRYGYDQIIAERQLSQRKLNDKSQGNIEPPRKKRSSFNYIQEDNTRMNSLQNNSNLRRNYFTHTSQVPKQQTMKSRPKYQYMQQYQPDRRQLNNSQRSRQKNSASSNNFLRRKYDIAEQTPAKKQAVYRNF